MKFLIGFTFFVYSFCTLLRAKCAIVGRYNNSGRVFNGHNAVRGQFPYMVRLEVALDSETTKLCGGSLIGHNWVLTAAHCVSNVPHVNIYLGSVGIEEADILYTASRNEIVIHPKWRPTGITADIALIYIPYTEYCHVLPIALQSITSSQANYIGHEAIVCGWGETGDSGFSSDILQWSHMPIIAHEICDVLGPDLLCTSSQHSSICSGDSGGPLILEATGELIGVTSFMSIDGCGSREPAVFTRIANYLRWIKSITGISYNYVKGYN